MMMGVRLRGTESLKDFLSAEQIRETIRPDVQFGRRAVSLAEEVEWARSVNPSDGIEFVPWMHEATGMSALFYGIADDYGGIGALTGVSATDPYAPGVRTPNIYYSRAYRDGGDAIAEGQTFHINGGGVGQIITPHVIGYGAVSPLAWSIQWVAALLEWVKLARSPFKNKAVRFGEFYGRPTMNAFLVTPARAPVVRVSFVVSSDREMTYGLEGRKASDYTKTMFKTNIRLPAGQQRVNYFVSAVPTVPDFALTITPQGPMVGAVNEMDHMPKRRI